MKRFHLEEMTKGWFVGAFAPTAFFTSDCEVAVKRYHTGDHEPAHVHRIATEVTVIISGRVRMNAQEFSSNDVVVLEPGDATDFEVLEETVTVVVKVPCVAGDKYPLSQPGVSA